VRDPGPARVYAARAAGRSARTATVKATSLGLQAAERARVQFAALRVWTVSSGARAAFSSRPAPRLDVFLRPCLCGCPDAGCGCFWQAAAEMDPPVGGGEAGQVRCPSLSLSLAP
jgi:hypothetical protein